jgi:hypothetical protein
VTDEGVITIGGGAFTGELLLTSGSQYQIGGNGNGKQLLTQAVVGEYVDEMGGVLFSDIMGGSAENLEEGDTVKLNLSYSIEFPGITGSLHLNSLTVSTPLISKLISEGDGGTIADLPLYYHAMPFIGDLLGVLQVEGVYIFMYALDDIPVSAITGDSETDTVLPKNSILVMPQFSSSGGIDYSQFFQENKIVITSARLVKQDNFIIE